ncbi:MAG TPA: HAD hydrolase family protein [Ktedonobacterales bacterium]|nr:HAD hydrolase family protein [Ktedonobacterales bacterium]
MATPLYRLLMLDIDGTLLNEQGQITPRTRRAVGAAQAAGVVVALATARRHLSATLFAADLGLKGPVVSYDGALIREYPSGEHWHSDPLPAVTGQAAVDAIARHSLQPLAQYNQENSERVLTGPQSQDTPWMGDYYDLYAAQFVRYPLAELCVGKGDPLRIVAFGPLEQLEPIAAELRPLPCQLYLNPQGSYGTAELSVMSLTTSKGNALSVLGSRLRLAPDQSMALGDSYNDLSMLRLAGLGVAMGQAPQEVQTAAGAVTLPNTEDGAARAIERYLLDGKLPEE